MSESVFVVNSYKGLGTMFWVELFLSEEEKTIAPIKEIQAELEHTITAFEKRYSRFNKDSFLNELNSKKRVPYDYDLATMLEEGKNASQATDNTFNIFIKEILEEKGYGDSGITPINKNSREKSDTLVTQESITLLGNRGIDLGGIGKGYLIDKLKKILEEKYLLRYFVINGGGDIYVTSNHGKEIKLFLEHPTESGQYLNTIALKDSALCCSSSFKRRWKKGTQEVNHFVNTDEGADEVWAASYVVGKSTTIADIYATVFCILSQQKQKLESFATRAHLEYVVIGDDGNIFVSKGFPKFLEKV